MSFKKVLHSMGEPYVSESELVSFHSVSKVKKILAGGEEVCERHGGNSVTYHDTAGTGGNDGAVIGGGVDDGDALFFSGGMVVLWYNVLVLCAAEHGP